MNTDENGGHQGYGAGMDDPQAYLLIVEDDPDILQLLSLTLTYSGYRVLTARNGLEGLDAIRNERPAIVIADIMMPRLDGFGLVNRLRINPETRDIPVVFITATYVAPEDRIFAQNIGATRFIQKPLDLDELLRTIRELLKQGTHVASEPPRDFSFYDEYRQRLEAKLEQKTAQIAREGRLLETDLSSEEHSAIRLSLERAVHEQDEIQHLLKEIREHLKKY